MVSTQVPTRSHSTELDRMMAPPLTMFRGHAPCWLVCGRIITEVQLADQTTGRPTASLTRGYTRTGGWSHTVLLPPRPRHAYEHRMAVTNSRRVTAQGVDEYSRVPLCVPPVLSEPRGGHAVRPTSAGSCFSAARANEQWRSVSIVRMVLRLLDSSTPTCSLPSRALLILQ